MLTETQWIKGWVKISWGIVITILGITFGLTALGLGSAPGEDPDPIHTPTLPPQDRISFLHSHNDFEQKNPLQDAIDHRFDSVEADVWQVLNQVLVSHSGFSYKGSLKELYLDPLQKRVDKQGSVYGDGKPFYLWIDLKPSTATLMTRIHELLAKYPMLTVFKNEKTIPGPVTVILTGNTKLKNDYVEKKSLRFATSDSSQLLPNSSAQDNRRLWYALYWGDLFEWDGLGPISNKESLKLINLVKTIHSQGKKLRLWGAPDVSRVWNECLISQVDMIGTDRLTDFRRFMDAF